MSKKIFGLVTALVASAVLMPNAFAQSREVRQEQHGMNYAWQMLWNSMVCIQGMEIIGQVP